MVHIVGPSAPQTPYPIFLSGSVQHGFGRGSKDLGCPTGLFHPVLSHILSDPYLLTPANLPDESILSMTSVVNTGIYYGYAQVLPHQGQDPPLCGDDIRVQPMVMSLGWNPFFQNERLTAVSGKNNCLYFLI
jgi:riboflavin kinase